MNEKFFSLPQQKQQAIINAGYRVFSQNSYKKSPMNEIAMEAGISKALLFYYFRNKKDLYLFLWEKGAQITIEELSRCGCYGSPDLFETMYIGIQAKIRVMRQYPDLGTFVVKAFYEKDPEVCPDIQKSVIKYSAFKENAKLLNLDPAQFRPGMDLQMMYQQMHWASEGYIWEKVQRGAIDVDQMEKDFEQMVAFWRETYMRKED